MNRVMLYSKPGGHLCEPVKEVILGGQRGRGLELGAGGGGGGNTRMLSKLKRQGVAGVIVGIGDNRVRKTYAGQVVESGLELINAIHPSAVVSKTAIVGRNVLIAAGAVVS